MGDRLGGVKPAARARVRRPKRTVAVLAFVIHSLAVAWIWGTWESGLRSGWLVWMDLPVSLLYFEAKGRALLAASLVLGGGWWAALGAALTAGVGLVARNR